ncbi:MAG: PASTA domain-containing protein [Spirochaetota bacterium]|nr:PASTA domain-containing protein [Spirochaetota bacterium]
MKGKEGYWNSEALKNILSKVVGPTALLLLIGISLYLFISTIILIFLTESEKEVKIPYVVGKRFIDVYNSLERSGLSPEISFYDVFDIDNGVILNQHPECGSIVSEGTKLKLIVSRSNLLVDVPNLIGLQLPFAMNKMKNLHVYNRSISLGIGVISYIQSDKSANNIVIDQNPIAGEEVTPDRKINLLVSAGKSDIDMKMPNLIGQSIDLCFNLLLSKGLSIYEEIKITSSKKMSGLIISQEPKKGTPISKGDKAKLKIYYYPLKEHPYISYEKIDYTVPTNRERAIYEAYIEDDSSKRVRFYRQMDGGETMSFVFKRRGNARISIVSDKKIIEVIGIRVQNFE